MAGESGDGPRRGRGRLVIGPGRHQAELTAVLQALGAPEPLRLADLAELLELPADVERVVLDSDELPSEDVGILRRFVARGRAQVVMTGLDSRARTARKVLALAGTGWMAWPPDLDQLRALIDAPAPAAAQQRGGAPPRTEPEPLPAPRERAAPRAPVPRTAAAETPPESDEEGPEPAAEREEPEAPRAVPPVLDRFEQAFERLRATIEPGDESRPAVEACAAELEQVLAWGRRGARAPGAGGDGPQVLDLGEILEEVLAGVAVGGGDAPRFLYRSKGDLSLRGRRMPLAAGLEALFRAARLCADAGTVVQVHAERDAEAGSAEPRVRLTVNFPAGLLDPEEVRRVLDGGGVPADLSGIEALTELSRAASYLHAVDAALQLERDPFNRLIVEVGLRGAAAGESATPEGRGRLEPASSELDPFA